MGFFTSAAKEQQKIEQVLAQFPGPVTLYHSRLKWTVAALICMSFVAVGAFLLQSDTDSGLVRRIGWIMVMSFGSGVAFAFVQMLRGAASMTLDANGFQIVSLYGRFAHSWRDAMRFTVWRFGVLRIRIVVFDELTTRSRLLALDANVAGRNSGLPDSYGFKAEMLAELMTRWRARAIQRP